MHNMKTKEKRDITACVTHSPLTRHFAYFWFQELERSWRDYDRLSADVTLAKTNLLEQLEALGSPQVPHMKLKRTLKRIDTHIRGHFPGF